MNEINNRLKVFEGESVHDIVKSRLAHDHQEHLLDILHTAHKDLETLSEAMLSNVNDTELFLEESRGSYFPRRCRQMRAYESGRAHGRVAAFSKEQALCCGGYHRSTVRL